MKAKRRLMNSVVRGLLSLGLATGLAVAVGEAHSAEFNMKMAVVTAEDAETNYLGLVKQAVEAASKGKIEGQIFTRGQLGSQSASIQGLQLGTIEAFITPADFYSGV